MRKKSLIVRYQTHLFDILSALSSDKYEDKIVLILENDKIFQHPHIFWVFVSRFYSRIESVATDSTAIRHVCEKLHIATIPLSSVEEWVELSHIKNPLAKMSIFEYFLYECRRWWWHTSRFFSRQKKYLTYKKPLELSGFLLLLLVLSLSCVILFFVMYFSITRTTIEIIPEIATKSYSRNVVLTTVPNQSVFRRDNEFPILQLSEEVSLEQSFDVNTFDPKTTKNAKWVIRVSNELPIEQQLRTGTRFVTQSGVVFRALSWVKLPPMRVVDGQVTPGQVEVAVVADPLDDKGVIIGTRGNIGTGVYMTIPALKFNQEKIYAESVWVFSSGENPQKKILTQEGYDRYAELYREKLRLQAIDQIKNNLEKHPWYDDKSGWEVIPLFQVWDFSYAPIELKDGLRVGDAAETVFFLGKVSVRAYAYPRSIIETYMSERFYESTLPEAQEVKNVDTKSMNIESLSVIDADTSSWVTLKSTLRVQGDIMYNFSHPNNLLLRQMRNLIVGKKIDDAKTILVNDPNIADVSISVSPFFLDRISSRIDAIDFYIHSQQ